MESQAYKIRQLIAGAVCSLFTSLSSAGPMDHWKLSEPVVRNGFQDYLVLTEGDTSYKVFVMSPRGAWAWRSMHDFDLALKDAQVRCTGLTSAARCKLFAVGDTIVWDMSKSEQQRVIAEYKATKMALPVKTTAPLSPSAVRGLGAYRYDDEGPQFRVFVVNEYSGAWAYRRRPTFKEAWDEATLSCETHSREARYCRVFAVGDTIVWDMPEKDRQAAIAAYRNKNDN